jgi:hypothetical protein
LLPFEKAQIGPDIIAGITLGALGIPEVMGYTKIIGTPVDQSSSYTRHVPARHGRLLLFDGATYDRDLCPSLFTDPDVGWSLSLEVFSIVAVGVLLLGIQLFDGRLRRRSSAAGMAELGANRKCYVLMCGLSTALLFAIVHRLVEGKVTRLTNRHYR